MYEPAVHTCRSSATQDSNLILTLASRSSSWSSAPPTSAPSSILSLSLTPSCFLPISVLLTQTWRCISFYGASKGGGEQERLSKKAAWDQKTFTSRLWVGFFASLGKENKKPATKMIQYESWGGKLWTPNWLRNSVLAPVKEIMLYEGEKVLAFFPYEIHFLKIGKIHIQAQSLCLKKLKLEPFWGKNPLWCQSGYSCLSRPGLGSTDWDHSLWWLHFSPPVK